jgi:hypothetical protein
VDDDHLAVEAVGVESLDEADPHVVRSIRCSDHGDRRSPEELKIGRVGT